MRRLSGIIAAGIGAAFVACSQPEPIGPLTASVDRAVVVNPSAATLDVGGTQQFSAQLVMNGRQKKAAFTWSSSDPAVATVSTSGLVTAVSGGEATITAAASRTLSGSAIVTVNEAPPPPPQVVAHIVLGGDPFGSAVSAPGVGWVGNPQLGQLTRLDLAAGTVTGTASPGPWPVQISAKGDGSRVYVPNFFSNGMVTSTNTTTLQTVDTVFATSNSEDAYGVANMATGDTVFIGLTNGPIIKVEMTSRTVLGRLDLPVAAGYHFEWNKNQTLLYASQRGFDGGRVFELDPRSFALLRTFETGGSAQAIQLSADDGKLFVAAQNGGVIVWDVASNSLITTYATPGCTPYGLVRTPDNTRLFVSCVFEGLVEILDPTSGALLASVSVGGQPRELSFDASSGSLIVPNESGWVDIIR